MPVRIVVTGQTEDRQAVVRALLGLAVGTIVATDHPLVVEVWESWDQKVEPLSDAEVKYSIHLPSQVRKYGKAT